MVKSMEYIVITMHETNYPDPIILKEGDEVKLGHIYDGPEDWPDWIYCYHAKSSKEGWVPEQIIMKKGEFGILKINYSANELNVSVGDVVEGFQIINGWIWCKNMSNMDEGWVPIINLQEKR